MSKTITISNTGELELNAIMLMGASTKREDDTKIGMFGTGFKYAIAVLIRAGYAIRITSGTTKIDFSTKSAALGGKDFQQVQMSVESPYSRARTVPLSFTTEMGPQWTVDNAMREIICNAKDAGGLEVEVGDPLKPTDGITRVALTAANPQRTQGRAEEHLRNFDQYYLFNRSPIYKDAKIAIYNKIDTCTNVYRNGVRVFRDEGIQSAYDYEVAASIDERRQAALHSCTWEIAYNIGSLTREYILRILECSGKENYFERLLTSFYGGLALAITAPEGKVYCTEDQAEMWAAGRYGRALEGFTPFIVNKDAYAYLKEQPQSRTVHSIMGAVAEGYTEIPLAALSDIERLTLNSALAFCKDAGYPVPEGKLKLYTDDDDTVFGAYAHGDIWIKQVGLGRGVFETVHTIIHELAHYHSGQPDASRGFEDYLLRELVSSLQHKVGRAL